MYSCCSTDVEIINSWLSLNKWINTISSWFVYNSLNASSLPDTAPSCVPISIQVFTWPPGVLWVLPSSPPQVFPAGRYYLMTSRVGNDCVVDQSAVFCPRQTTRLCQYASVWNTAGWHTVQSLTLIVYKQYLPSCRMFQRIVACWWLFLTLCFFL